MSARRIIRLLALPLLLLAGVALAHTVAEGDQDFVKNSTGAQIVPFIYLGAKHMILTRSSSEMAWNTAPQAPRLTISTTRSVAAAIVGSRW